MENQISEIVTLLTNLVANNELLFRRTLYIQNKLNLVNERLNTINEVNQTNSSQLAQVQEHNMTSAMNIRDNFEIVHENITNIGFALKNVLKDLEDKKNVKGDSGSTLDALGLEKLDKNIGKLKLFLNDISISVNDIKSLDQSEFSALKKEFSQIKQSITNNSSVSDDSPVLQNKDMGYIRVSPFSVHYNNFFLEPNLVFSKESCLVGISTGIDITDTNKNVGFHFSSSLELTKDKLSVCMKNGSHFSSRLLGFSPSNFSKLYIEKRMYKNTEKQTSNTFITFQTSVEKRFPSFQKRFVNFYSSADLNLSLPLKDDAETTNCEKVPNNVLIWNEEPIFKSNLVNTVESSVQEPEMKNIFSRSISPLEPTELRQPISNSNSIYFTSILIFISGFFLFFVTNLHLKKNYLNIKN